MRSSEGTPAGRWTILYDAECGLCRALLAPLLRWDRRGHLQPLALQALEAEGLLGDLSPQERIASWHLVSPAGSRWSAGAALPPLLRQLPGGRPPAALFARSPALTERGYRWVAAHRAGLAHLLPARLRRRADYLRSSHPA